MKAHSAPALISVLAFIFLFYPSVGAQTPSSGSGPNPQLVPSRSDEMVEVTYSEIEIVNPGKLPIPVTLIQRIFRETVREVARHLNPNRPPLILAKVTLRFGEPGVNVETTMDKERHTVIRMQRWDELLFARMVARAARHGLFSDEELDKSAQKALNKVHAVTSVTELKQAQ